MGNLTGKEVAQMHKDYVMQSWSKSGVDALPVEKAKGIYFWDYDGKKYALVYSCGDGILRWIVSCARICGSPN